MRPLGFAVFTFLNASLFSWGPVALLVLIPNLWWGFVIKGVSVFILFGAAGNLLRETPAKHAAYGAAAPGFVINMPLFALALWLEAGIVKAAFAFLFLFIATATLFMIYDNAKSRLGNRFHKL